MSVTYTVAAGENGYVDTGPTWVTGAAGVLLVAASSALPAALRLTTLPVSSQARSKPPTPIYTSSLTYSSMSLYLYKIGGGSGTLTVRVMTSPTAAAWSGSNLPTVTSGTLVATLVDTSTSGPLTIPLDPATGSTTSKLGNITPIYRSSRWPGSLAFVLVWTGATRLRLQSAEGAALLPNPSLYAPALITESVPEFTGLEGPAKAQSRADRCPRCGQPSLRETWLQDGYGKTFVCQDCWDPGDPLWHRRTPRPSKPGINDVG